MPTVIYVEPDGFEKMGDVAVGRSAMEGVIQFDVRGLPAECRGACACSTCHVHVASEWMDIVGQASDAELATLELARDVRSSSRLSCQITLTDQMDGLKLYVVAPAN